MSHIVNQNFLHIRNTRACALENPMFGSMTSGIFTTAERGRGGDVKIRGICISLRLDKKGGRRDGTVEGLSPNAKEMPLRSKGSLGVFPNAAPFPVAWGVFATADEASADWNVVANAERGQPQTGSTDKRRNWPTCLHIQAMETKKKICLARARQTGGASRLALGKATRTLCSWNAVPPALVS